MNAQQAQQVAAMQQAQAAAAQQQAQAQQNMMNQNGQNQQNGHGQGPPPGQPGQPGNMAAMYGQHGQAPPPGAGIQQQVVYPDGMGMPPMPHMPQRHAFDPSQGYPQGHLPHMVSSLYLINYSTLFQKATPTSQGSGQVVYHNGHPHQPGPGQMSIPPGATPGTIIHYQLSESTFFEI